MRELSLREIQLGELEILKKFAQICDEQGFKYFLHAGTLIGAIRHGGFIPWDDDVDVIMPREDYDKFVEYYKCNKDKLSPFSLMHYSTNVDYIYAIARFCDTRYKIDYDGAKDYGLGLFIDIYPLDGWGNEEDDPHDILETMKFDLVMISLAGHNAFYRSPKGIIRTVVKALAYLYASFMGAAFFAKKLEKRAKKRRYGEDKYVGVTSWNVYGIGERINKEDLEPMQAIFEGYEFNIPVGYDRILRNTYGDYMTPPPEKDRIGHHNYRAYTK